MKTIFFKGCFVVIVMMGSMQTAAFAETLSEAITELDKAKATQGRVSAIASAETLSQAIDEALVVPLATMEAFSVYKAAINEISARSEEAKNQEEMDSWAKPYAARAATAIDEAIAHAKAGQGHKKRATHCKAILQSDDPVEVVKCLETLDDIVGACITNPQYARIKELGISWDIEGPSYAEQQRAETVFEQSLLFSDYGYNSILRNRYKELVDGYKELVNARTYNDFVIKEINEAIANDTDNTLCVKETITDYSRFVVSMFNQDRYAGLVKRCAKKTKGVLGYRLIWPCVKRYREMIGEPVGTGSDD